MTPEKPTVYAGLLLDLLTVTPQFAHRYPPICSPLPPNLLTILPQFVRILFLKKAPQSTRKYLKALIVHPKYAQKHWKTLIVPPKSTRKHLKALIVHPQIHSKVLEDAHCSPLFKRVLKCKMVILNLQPFYFLSAYAFYLLWFLLVSVQVLHFGLGILSIRFLSAER